MTEFFLAWDFAHPNSIIDKCKFRHLPITLANRICPPRNTCSYSYSWYIVHTHFVLPINFLRLPLPNLHSHEWQQLLDWEQWEDTAHPHGQCYVLIWAPEVSGITAGLHPASFVSNWVFPNELWMGTQLSYKGKWQDRK